MELTHDFTVPASIDDAWATFMDLERVGSCFPGATVTSVDESGFGGTVKVKLGPIALQYTGSGQFLERDDAAHRAVIEAKGKDKRGNGTAGATVTVQLAPSGAGTRIDVTTDLAITGKPAQFGRGVMQDVSDKLLQQFVQCIEGQFAAAEPDAAAGQEPPADAVAGPNAPSVPDDAAAAPSSGSAGASAGSAGSAGSAESAARPAVAPAAENAGAAASTTPPAARPLRPAPPVDDSIDLGATVLPVLVKSYAPYGVAALAGLVLGWLIGRRNS
ncbi:MAG: SRPBCC domain-containing protein [Ornithinibacter sp.]